MQRSFRIALALAAAALLPALPAASSQKLADETGLKCVSCHDKPGSRLLTDRGKYFEFKRTVDGYDAIQTSFGRCTSCHVRRPGSTKLTKKGQKMAGMVKDMSELQKWLEENHPVK